MTSAAGGGGGSPKSRRKKQNQLIDDREKRGRGSKNPNLRKLFMEAPFMMVNTVEIS